MSEWLKVAPDEAVAAMSVCNEGGASEVIKHFLKTEVNEADMPQGNIIEQFITVANTSKHKKLFDGVIVDKAAKSGDTTQAVRDICDVIKEIATQSISESAVVCLENKDEELFNIIQDANSEFTKNVVEFLQMIPQMTKEAFMNLSAEITGKMEYINLINCALLSSTGVYILYRLINESDKTEADKGEEDEATKELKDDEVAEDLKKVAESRNSLMGASVCVRNALVMLKENKEAGLDIYSSYIENAVKLLNEIVNDKEIANSPYIELLEVLISKIAAPYDEYIQDVKDVITGGAGKEEKEPKEQKPEEGAKAEPKEPEVPEVNDNGAQGEEGQEGEEPKKKRGRPKKEPEEGLEGQPEQPKRKRGRPKKSETNPEAAEGGQESAEI